MRSNFNSWQHHGAGRPTVAVFDEWAPRTSTVFRGELIMRSGARAVPLSPASLTNAE